MSKGPMRGPGGPGGPGPMGPMQKPDKATMKRLLSYLKAYKFQFTTVLICILVSALVGVASSMFLQTLIDDYIAPLLLQAHPVFDGLLSAVLTMAVIYVIGVGATFLYALR